MIRAGYCLSGRFRTDYENTQQEQDNAAAALQHGQMPWFAQAGAQMAGKKRMGKSIGRAKQDKVRYHDIELQQ